MVGCIAAQMKQSGSAEPPKRLPLLPGVFVLPDRES